MTKSKNYIRNSTKFRGAVNYRTLNKPGETKKLILKILVNQPDFYPALGEMDGKMEVKNQLGKKAKFIIILPNEGIDYEKT